MSKPSLVMEVVTSDANGKQVGQTRTYDQYDHRGRAWMAKHCWWAAHEGYAVHSRPQPRNPVTGQPVTAREQFEMESG